jgi:hypothetical protein
MLNREIALDVVPRPSSARKALWLQGLGGADSADIEGVAPQSAYFLDFLNKTNELRFCTV